MWDDAVMSRKTSSLPLAFAVALAAAAPALAVDSFDAGNRPEFQHPQWQHAGFAHSDFSHSTVRFHENTLVHSDFTAASDSSFRAAPQDLKTLNLQNGLGTTDPTSPNQVSPFTNDEQARFQNMHMQFEDPAFRRFNFN
jgi:hypothetical protein